MNQKKSTTEMDQESIFKFMEKHSCTVVHDSEKERWEMRVDLGGKIIGAHSNTLSECIKATINYMNEMSVSA